MNESYETLINLFHCNCCKLGKYFSILIHWSAMRCGVYTVTCYMYNHVCLWISVTPHVWLRKPKTLRQIVVILCVTGAFNCLVLKWQAQSPNCQWGVYGVLCIAILRNFGAKWYKCTVGIFAVLSLHCDQLSIQKVHRVLTLYISWQCRWFCKSITLL